MKQEKVVVINGRRYDPATGLPVKGPTPIARPEQPNQQHAQTVHSRTQKSKTLDRKAAKKPDRKLNQADTRRSRTPIRAMDIAVSKHISKFGPRNIKEVVSRTVMPQKADVGPVKHPLTAKIHQAKPEPPKPKTNQEIKNQAISKAVQDAQPSTKAKHKSPNPKKRRLTILILSVVVLITAGAYLAYSYMPSVSVNVAGVRAGIDASYPSYKPDGYKFKGATYQEGEVSIKYELRGSDEGFTLKQAKTSLDSTSLRDQVDKDRSGDFTTTKERGLTIYTYSGGASWIEGSTVYSIESSTLISGEQIRKIATSL